MTFEFAGLLEQFDRPAVVNQVSNGVIWIIPDVLPCCLNRVWICDALVVLRRVNGSHLRNSALSSRASRGRRSCLPRSANELRSW